MKRRVPLLIPNIRPRAVAQERSRDLSVSFGGRAMQRCFTAGVAGIDGDARPQETLHFPRLPALGGVVERVGRPSISPMASAAIISAVFLMCIRAAAPVLFFSLRESDAWEEQKNQRGHEDG